MTTENRPTSGSWWRTAPVLTIAVLALIMSTAGGAYAVAKNSIGTKQLKNNAVTSSKIKSSTIRSSDIKNGSIGAGDLAPGTIPAAGPKVYFAKVNGSGGIVAASPGIVSSSREAEGTYTVQLTFDPQTCAYVTTAITSTYNTSANRLNSGAISVFSRDSMSGTITDSGFSLVVTC